MIINKLTQERMMSYDKIDKAQGVSVRISRFCRMASVKVQVGEGMGWNATWQHLRCLAMAPQMNIGGWDEEPEFARAL